MEASKFTDLIIKFLNHDITGVELDTIDRYLSDDRYTDIFKSYVEAHYLSDYTFRNFNSLEAKKEIIQRIRAEKVKRKKQRNFYLTAAAASVALLISLPFILKNIHGSVNDIPLAPQEQRIVPGTDKATLTLEDGETVALEKGTIYTRSGINSDGKNLIYAQNTAPKDEQKISYNYLTIPRGGQFYVKLGDGTEVTLNSESKLKYPVTFKEGNPREVELVYGEAYFEVSPSSNHNGSKFYVHTGLQEIEVLGTAFNIKAYQDETQIYSTLVEGKINLNIGDESEVLVPGQQAIVSEEGALLDIKPVDTFNVISWKKGIFSFEREPLSKIMKVLSRWYDFETDYQSESIKEIKFTGILDKTQKIENILTTIKNLGFIDAYEIDQDRINLK